MQFRTSDMLASTLAALLLTWIVSLRYALDFGSAWPWLFATAVAFDGGFLFLLQNQSKNYRKWSKHPTVFPNPVGGGIVGEYMMRPWQNELAMMGQPKLELSKKELEKLNRISRRKTRRTRQLQKNRTK